MEKKYWHELTKEQVSDFIQDAKNLCSITDIYKQPDWCNYPDALEGILGCWSLLSHTKDIEINEEYCSKCYFFKNK